MEHNPSTNTETMQDTLLFFAQEVSETVYDKFVQGELNQQEFEQAYTLLKRWTNEGEFLLNLLN